ncbi:MAG: pilus assembly protein TadG-related protein [Gemmataceae bacterium]
MILSANPVVGGSGRRQGTIVCLLAVTLVVLISFLALAIDIGMLATARTQAQHAADLAALTAARTVNGNPTGSYNQATATTNAQNVLSYNYILAGKFKATQLQLSYGSYDYDQSTQTFSANFPAASGHPSTAIAATVTANNIPGAFSTVMGNQFLPNVWATSQAVHRPRDIALVLDLSGSMRMSTCLGYDFYTTTRTSNNPDPAYPKFGHYSSASAGMQGPSTNRTSAYDNYAIAASNHTYPNSTYSLTYVNNFFSNAAYAATNIRAFDSYTSTDGGQTWTAPSAGATPVLPPGTYTTMPGGDSPLFKNGSSTLYATNVTDVVTGSGWNFNWELDGYSRYTSGSLTNACSGQTDYTSSPFYGYTQGPAYYGKTFFIWPPDPRRHLTTTNDSALIKFFLMDANLNSPGGYTATDFSGAITGPPLNGIYNVTTTPGSHTWPWPNDGGTSLSTYLLTRVFIPGGLRLLTVADTAYLRIMRLYARDYVIDNTGTTSCDWRVRFFGTNDNTKLFNASGSLNPPGSTGMSSAITTYNAILKWITQSPNPFPSQLRAGRVKYYNSIPTAITGTWPDYGSTDQRFWVEYIDYVLGFVQTSAGVYQDVSAMAGYGSDFTWGTLARNTPPTAPGQYMNYSDNPLRPKLRHWFGPLNMIEYLQNYNLDVNVASYNIKQPGDSYEAPVYVGKLGYLGAIDEMENNHPNDWVTIVPYSMPRSAATGTAGRYNTVACPLGTNYAYARSALLFPFSTINADGTCNNTEVTPYDKDPSTNVTPSANFVDIPRADGNTCFSMALMHCYNQFVLTPSTDTTLRTYTSSTPITFPTAMAGGMGRKGAQKVVIFETDGLPNTTATANLVGAGTYSYYKIRYDMNKETSSEYPVVTVYTNNNATVVSQVTSLVQQMATDFSTSRNPFRLYAIGFGPVFSGPDANAALQTLQSMQYYAGTQSSPTTALDPNQIITGTDTQMTSKMSS